VFDNRRVLEAYSQDDVTVLREASRVLIREFMQIGNRFSWKPLLTRPHAIVLLKGFLKPVTIGIIPTGGYSGNVNHSKKALMWLVYKEIMDGGREILHGRNGREYGLTDLTNFSVDGYARRRAYCTNFSAIATTLTTANPIVTSIRCEGTS